MENDPLALPRFRPLLDALRALPSAPAAAPDFPSRVLAAATGRDDASPLVASLRNLPPAAPASPDFAQRVLAAARSADRTRALRIRSLRLLELAAVLAVLLAAVLWRPAADPLAPAVALLPTPAALTSDTPLDSLLRLQRNDGSWLASPAPALHDPGVTALAVLALLYASPAPLDSPQAPSIRAGIDALLRAQRPGGDFAPPSPTAPYVNYLAIKALQTAAACPGADPAWTRAAAQAAPHLPPPAQIAAFNRRLAHPDTAAPDWPSSSDPAAQAALALLRR